MQQVEITITQNSGVCHSFKFPRLLLRDMITEVVGTDLAERAMADFETLGRYEFLPEAGSQDEESPVSIRLNAVENSSGHLI